MSDLTRFESVLGESQVLLCDGWSGKPIAWGRPITEHLGDQRFAELRAEVGADLVCIRMGSWGVVERRLTREEAIAQYGEITDEEFGPRGGWKSVTFGETKFIHKSMKAA